MIAIASFGVGNVRALANIYERHGVPVVVATTEAQIESATHVILPGVGAFDWTMEKLEASGLRPALDRAALVRCRPILGICVGMQMMVEQSEEGDRKGLAWIQGTVRQFSRVYGGHAVALPHMGWNNVEMQNDPLFDGLEAESMFYFLHSYYVEPAETAQRIARTEYGKSFTSAMRFGNVVGVQFHPEKSHHWGEKVLLNFAAQR